MDNNKYVNIAIMGFGTVGSGVWELIKLNREGIKKRALKEVRVRRILDQRDFPGHEAEGLLTKDFNDILNDPEIHIVVEAMGGVDPAYSFSVDCLKAGKSVVTSNKAVVSVHGAELMRTAQSNNANFLFEASVGGGIPIIRPLNHSLSADRVVGIQGIVNGTTNYILTKMAEENVSFELALSGAKSLGYAERDPSDDVNGVDSSRKLAILLALATGHQIDYTDIPTTGISEVAELDVEMAKKTGMKLKLLASARIVGNDVFAETAPVMIRKNSPLFGVDYSYNAVAITGEFTGEVMFYGQGAGKMPTAGAVVSDVIDAARHLNVNIMHFWSEKKLPVHTLSNEVANFCVRMPARCDKAAVSVLYPDAEFIGTRAFLTGDADKALLKIYSETIGPMASAYRVL